MLKVCSGRAPRMAQRGRAPDIDSDGFELPPLHDQKPASSTAASTGTSPDKRVKSLGLFGGCTAGSHGGEVSTDAYPDRHMRHLLAHQRPRSCYQCAWTKHQKEWKRQLPFLSSSIDLDDVPMSSRHRVEGTWVSVKRDDGGKLAFCLQLSAVKSYFQHSPSFCMQ